MSAAEFAIELRGISKSYGPIVANHNVTLRVRAGQVHALVGENGAGKSTLVKIIGGVEEPTRGRMICDLFMSWPIAFAGGFEPAMSGPDNIRFIARI